MTNDAQDPTLPLTLPFQTWIWRLMESHGSAMSKD